MGQNPQLIQKISINTLIRYKRLIIVYIILLDIW